MNEKYNNYQLDECLTKAAAVLLPKETGAQHQDRLRPIACLTLGNIKCESFQTAFVKTNHPLHGAFSILMAVEEAKECDIHSSQHESTKKKKNVEAKH